VEQHVSLVTLGVSDYGRAKAFYEALGWSPALEVQETAFFQANGLILVLWARDKLAEDMGLPDDGARWSGIALAHNVRSREAVHEVVEQARGNGAEVTREPAETFYGDMPALSAISTATPGRLRTTPALAWTTTATSSFLPGARERRAGAEDRPGPVGSPRWLPARPPVTVGNFVWK
jgi:predicted lactoylglutathione lyase